MRDLVEDGEAVNDEVLVGVTEMDGVIEMVLVTEMVGEGEGVTEGMSISHMKRRLDVVEMSLSRSSPEWVLHASSRCCSVADDRSLQTNATHGDEYRLQYANRQLPSLTLAAGCPTGRTQRRRCCCSSSCWRKWNQPKTSPSRVWSLCWTESTQCRRCHICTNWC